jgi:hypothetical protein
MSEDVKEKLDAYKQGYKDGYNDAVKFYVVDPIKNTHPDHYRCPICGISGVHSSVCYLPNCPSRAYATGAIGAAGSSYFNKIPVSGNGAAGY